MNNTITTSFQGKEVTDPKINGSVFFQNNTWGYVARYVNSNYMIEYETKDGFLTKKAAEIEKNKTEKKYERDIRKIKNFTDMKYTFFEFLLHWEHVMVYMYGTPAMQTKYNWIIHKLIIPNTKNDILLGMATPAYFNDIIAKCKPECISAGSQVSELMHMILRDALSERLIDPKLIDDVITVPRNHTKMMLYNKQQLRCFLQGAKRSTCYLEILLALFCGLREGEVLGLKFTDFDETTRSVSIRRQFSEQYHFYVQDGKTYRTGKKIKEFKPPKTPNSYRKLVVPEIVWQALCERKEYNDYLYASHPTYTKEFYEYICIGQNGNIKSASTLNNAIRTICSNMGLPRLTMHPLRHIFASMCLENGCPLNEISAALGHARESLTFDIYCGIIDAKKDSTDVIEQSMNPINTSAGGYYEKNSENRLSICP